MASRNCRVLAKPLRTWTWPGLWASWVVEEATESCLPAGGLKSCCETARRLISCGSKLPTPATWAPLSLHFRINSCISASSLCFGLRLLLPPFSLWPHWIRCRPTSSHPTCSTTPLALLTPHYSFSIHLSIAFTSTTFKSKVPFLYSFPWDRSPLAPFSHLLLLYFWLFVLII